MKFFKVCIFSSVLGACSAKDGKKGGLKQALKKCRANIKAVNDIVHDGTNSDFIKKSTDILKNFWEKEQGFAKKKLAKKICG